MSKVAPLNNEVAQKLAAKALESIPAIRFSFWENEDRTKDNNYAHYKGEVEISTVKLAAMLAEALEQGKTSVRMFGDLRKSTPREGVNRPALFGNARKVIVPRG